MHRNEAIARLIGPLAILTVSLLSACTQSPLRGQGPSQPIELNGVPYYPEEGYQGAPAALAMILAASGVQVTPESLVGLVYDAAVGNSPPSAIRNAPGRYGRVGYILRSKQIDLELLRQLQSGHPVLVLLHDGLVFKQWQYALVIGFDPQAGTLTLRSDSAPRLLLRDKAFLKAWREGGYWAMVIANPGEIPAAATVIDWLPAARLMEQSGKTEAATLAYAAITQRWPGAAEAWGGLGRLEYAQHDLRGATAAFNTAVTLQPDNAAYHHGLALALLDRKCADQAEGEVDRALELENDPRLRDAYLHTQGEVEQYGGPSVVCPLE